MSFLIVFGSLSVIFIGTLYYFFFILPEKQAEQDSNTKDEHELSSEESENEIVEKRPQRNTMNRMANRMRNRRQQGVIDSDEDQDNNFDDDENLIEEGDEPGANYKKFDPTKKLSKKEIAKMQKKQERKEMLDAMQQQREKDKQEREQAESREQELEELEKQREQEEEAKELEAKRQKQMEDQKQFDKWSSMFTIDAQGEQAEDDKAYELTLQKFVDYITLRKVVMFEDLAAEFNMQTKDAVDRVQKLQESGRLLGINDDRGKFIHITEQEFKSVSSYIKAKGRANRVDLLTECNRLIRMGPRPEDKQKIEQEQKALLDNVEKQFESEDKQQ